MIPIPIILADQMKPQDGAKDESIVGSDSAEIKLSSSDGAGLASWAKLSLDEKVTDVKVGAMMSQVVVDDVIKATDDEKSSEVIICLTLTADRQVGQTPGYGDGVGDGFSPTLHKEPIPDQP